MTTWSTEQAWGGTNLYRHKDAYYFLPTEDEWVKAAYWNGSEIQEYATIGDVTPTQDGWNFYDNGYATGVYGPWDVGSGSEEVNGTYDMMGNVWEWIENNFYSGYHSYFPNYTKCLRGGEIGYRRTVLTSSYRGEFTTPQVESVYNGFRVASVPEPATVSLLVLGGLALLRRRK